MGVPVEAAPAVIALAEPRFGSGASDRLAAQSRVAHQWRKDMNATAFRTLSTFVAALFMSGMLISAATSFPLA